MRYLIPAKRNGWTTCLGQGPNISVGRHRNISGGIDNAAEKFSLAV